MQPNILAFPVQVGTEHHVQWFHDPSRGIGNYWSHGITVMVVVLQVSLLTASAALLLLYVSTCARLTIAHLSSLKGFRSSDICRGVYMPRQFWDVSWYLDA